MTLEHTSGKDIGALGQEAVKSIFKSTGMTDQTFVGNYMAKMIPGIIQNGDATVLKNFLTKKAEIDPKILAPDTAEFIILEIDAFLTNNDARIQEARKALQASAKTQEVKVSTPVRNEVESTSSLFEKFNITPGTTFEDVEEKKYTIKTIASDFKTVTLTDAKGQNNVYQVRSVDGNTLKLQGSKKKLNLVISTPEIKEEPAKEQIVKTKKEDLPVEKVTPRLEEKKEEIIKEEPVIKEEEKTIPETPTEKKDEDTSGDIVVSRVNIIMEKKENGNEKKGKGGISGKGLLRQMMREDEQKEREEKEREIEERQKFEMTLSWKVLKYLDFSDDDIKKLKPKERIAKAIDLAKKKNIGNSFNEISEFFNEENKKSVRAMGMIRRFLQMKGLSDEEIDALKNEEDPSLDRRIAKAEELGISDWTPEQDKKIRESIKASNKAAFEITNEAAKLELVTDGGYTEEELKGKSMSVLFDMVRQLRRKNEKPKTFIKNKVVETGKLSADVIERLRAFNVNEENIAKMTPEGAAGYLAIASGPKKVTNPEMIKELKSFGVSEKNIAEMTLAGATTYLKEARLGQRGYPENTTESSTDPEQLAWNELYNTLGKDLVLQTKDILGYDRPSMFDGETSASLEKRIKVYLAKKINSLVTKYVKLIEKKASPEEIKKLLIDGTSIERTKKALALREPEVVEKNFYSFLQRDYPNLLKKIPAEKIKDLEKVGEKSEPIIKASGKIEPIGLSNKDQIDAYFDAISKEDWEKIKVLLRRKDLNIVVHGEQKDRKDPETVFAKTDLDAKMATYILSVLGNHPAGQVDFVEKGGELPEGIHLDSGKSKDLITIRDNQLFINHHFENKGTETSTTELVYELLKRVGEIKSEPWLDRTVSFINETDNLSYPKKGTEWFQNTFPKSICGLRQVLPFETIIELIKNGKNPYEALTDAELTKEMTSPYKEDNGQKVPLSTIADRVRKLVNDSISGIAYHLEQSFNQNLRGVTEELGKTIIYQRNKNTPKIPLGPEAAYNLGFDTYILRDFANNGYFISSPGNDLSKIKARIEKLDPKAEMMRGSMIVTKGDLTISPREFYNVLGLSMVSPENVESTVDKKIEDITDFINRKKFSTVKQSFDETELEIRKVMQALYNERREVIEKIQELRTSNLPLNIQQSFAAVLDQQKNIYDARYEAFNSKVKQLMKLDKTKKENLKKLFKTEQEHTELKKNRLNPEDILLNTYPELKTMKEAAQDTYIDKLEKDLEATIKKYDDAIKQNERSNKARSILEKLFS